MTNMQVPIGVGQGCRNQKNVPIFRAFAIVLSNITNAVATFYAFER
jgi:hypothetical protein